MFAELRLRREQLEVLRCAYQVELFAFSKVEPSNARIIGGVRYLFYLKYKGVKVGRVVQITHPECHVIKADLCLQPETAE